MRHVKFRALVTPNFGWRCVTVQANIVEELSKCHRRISFLPQEVGMRIPRAFADESTGESKPAETHGKWTFQVHLDPCEGPVGALVETTGFGCGSLGSTRDTASRALAFRIVCELPFWQLPTLGQATVINNTNQFRVHVVETPMEQIHGCRGTLERDYPVIRCSLACALREFRAQTAI